MLTKEFSKIQIHDGTQYPCTIAENFLQPILNEYLEDYPSVKLLLQDNRGFATSELYKQCEENGAGYVLRLKENIILREKAVYLIDELNVFFSCFISGLNFILYHREITIILSDFSHLPDTYKHH